MDLFAISSLVLFINLNFIQIPNFMSCISHETLLSVKIRMKKITNSLRDFLYQEIFLYFNNSSVINIINLIASIILYLIEVLPPTTLLQYVKFRYFST